MPFSIFLVMIPTLAPFTIEIDLYQTKWGRDLCIMKKHPWKKWIGQGLIAASILGISHGAWADSYTVQRGDTLFLISQRVDSTVDQLKTVNQLKSDEIWVGQVLTIPPKSITHTVQSGDTLYLISKQYNTTIQEIYNTNKLSTIELRIGQKLVIPVPAAISNETTYIVQSGDVLWKIAMNHGTTVEAILAYNGLSNGAYIEVGQALKIPTQPSPPVQTQPLPLPAPTEGPWVENQTYTVEKGDTGWSISLKFGIPFSEFLKANQMNQSSYLSIGQQVTIPVHHVPVKPTATPTAGELLDWWTEAQYVFPIGKTAKVTDIQTGLSWNLKRSFGEFHADCEPLTPEDAEMMKKIWGGTYSWAVRPVIVEVDGRRLAASVSSMPHDIETIKDNNFDGHHDMHFLNSRRHKDYLVDQQHQNAIKIAAGVSSN